MRALGYLLLWLGFVGAAFFAVSRLEQADDKWSTVPWGPYIGFMVVGAVGIVLLRNAQAQDHADEAKTEAEYSSLQENLGRVIELVESLRRHPNFSLSQVLNCIDRECTPALSTFADARQALVKRFDIQVFADVMTDFASGERYVNRAWSAAADGYIDEVHQSLEIAAEHLQAAQQKMEQAERAE